MSATPRPWRLEEFRPGDWRISEPDGEDGCWWICELSPGPDAESRGLRIVRAVNAHAANEEKIRVLKEALRGLMLNVLYLRDEGTVPPGVEGHLAMVKARAALKLAEGKP